MQLRMPNIPSGGAHVSCMLHVGVTVSSSILCGPERTNSLFCGWVSSSQRRKDHLPQKSITYLRELRGHWLAQTALES
ncbi:hypothetical protein BC835DRAFT_1343845 [Cytidiella melzeri]|nr:hypothetical protein BC835DRAFT_1343845 [Cytidiella melzeri]